jgi:hypothetical protein
MNIFIKIANNTFVNIKGVIYMENTMHGKHNSSIGCTVEECKFNDKVDQFCTLPKIQVEKHETKATSKQCTDCGSFQK